MSSQKEVEQGDPRTLLYWLGAELRAIRTIPLGDLAQEIPRGIEGRHIDTSTLSEFERGLRWPSHPDLTVAGYARVFETDARLIWWRAAVKFKNQKGETLPAEKPHPAHAAVRTAQEAAQGSKPAAGESRDNPISTRNRRAK